MSKITTTLQESAPYNQICKSWVSIKLENFDLPKRGKHICIIINASNGGDDVLAAYKSIIKTILSYLTENDKITIISLNENAVYHLNYCRCLKKVKIECSKIDFKLDGTFYADKLEATLRSLSKIYPAINIIFLTHGTIDTAENLIETLIPLFIIDVNSNNANYLKKLASSSCGHYNLYNERVPFLVVNLIRNMEAHTIQLIAHKDVRIIKIICNNQIVEDVETKDYTIYSYNRINRSILICVSLNSMKNYNISKEVCVEDFLTVKVTYDDYFFCNTSQISRKSETKMLDNNFDNSLLVSYNLKQAIDNFLDNKTSDNLNNIIYMISKLINNGNDCSDLTFDSICKVNQICRLYLNDPNNVKLIKPLLCCSVNLLTDMS